MKKLFRDIKDALLMILMAVGAVLVGLFSLNKRQKIEKKKIDRAKRIRARNKKINQVAEKLKQERKKTKQLQESDEQKINNLQKKIVKKDTELKEVEQKIKASQEEGNTNDVQISDQEVKAIISSLNDSIDK